MTISISEIAVFVLGSKGDLRNPRLEFLEQQTTYVEPVFLGEDFSPRVPQALREIALNGRKLTNGERGCALGHARVRDEIIRSDVAWALVLEDDVELTRGWVQKLENSLRQLGEEHFSVLLLNTNSLLDFGPDAVELSVRPSGANAFLISRQTILSRRYESLEDCEIADWPISFVRHKFLALSGIAHDGGGLSLVGIRPSSRTRFFVSTLVRVAFSPVICQLLKVSLRDFLRWAVLGPVIRDLKLRYCSSAAYNKILPED